MARHKAVTRPLLPARVNANLLALAVFTVMVVGLLALARSLG